MDSKQEFDHVSRLVKSELARFEQERIEDFKNSLETLLSGMISKQKEVRHFVCSHFSVLTSVQLIATWEAYQQSLLKRAAPPTQRPGSTEPTSS